MEIGMLHPDEAVRMVVAAGAAAWAGHIMPATESVELEDALGRILPAGLTALVDQPPFTKSAMDGFAWAGRTGSGAGQGGTGTVMRVAGTLAAGDASAAALKLRPGECIRIMTGAPLPAGCRAVQRVEWTEGSGRSPDGAELVRFTARETVSNVIGRGENQRAGDVLLTPRVLAPQDIGILASSGYARVEVARKPRVGIVSTGDEIVPPGSPLGPASIFDSNGPALRAQARAMGCEARWYGAFPDEEGALIEAFSLAIAENDVILVSGGVSMGEFDFVPKILASLGVERKFHKVAMRPGKPTWFGTLGGGKAVFGLPGNPMSTFVNFEILVKPHLAARAGLAYDPPVLRVPLAAPLARRGSDRVEYLPARLRAAPDGGAFEVEPLSYHGSSMLAVLAGATCLARMEIGVERMEKGEPVDVRLIRA